jgi:hypothetical protein
MIAMASQAKSEFQVSDVLLLSTIETAHLTAEIGRRDGGRSWQQVWLSRALSTFRLLLESHNTTLTVIHQSIHDPSLLPLRQCTSSHAALVFHRMFPLTAKRKALLPVGNIPLIAYALDILERAQFSRESSCLVSTSSPCLSASFHMLLRCHQLVLPLHSCARLSHVLLTRMLDAIVVARRSCASEILALVQGVLKLKLQVHVHTVDDDV